jgi:hypothetical protein
MKTLDEALRDHDAAVRACLSTDGVRADQMVVTNLYIPVRGRARPTAVEPASSAEACLEREITGWGLAWPGVDHAVHVIVRLPVPSSAAAAAPPGTPVQAEEIKDVVRKQAGKIQACYTEALGRNPKLEGQVVPSWAIHPDGAVAAVTIESDTIGDDVLATCMALRILDARFPAGIDPAGIVEVSFPFKFTIAREAPKAP